MRNTACELHSNALQCVVRLDTSLLDCMLYRSISMIQKFYQARQLSALIQDILYLIRCVKETIWWNRDHPAQSLSQLCIYLIYCWCTCICEPTAAAVILHLIKEVFWGLGRPQLIICLQDTRCCTSTADRYKVLHKNCHCTVFLQPHFENQDTPPKCLHHAVTITLVAAYLYQSSL